MVRIKIIRLSQLIYYTLIIILAVAVICLALRFLVPREPIVESFFTADQQNLQQRVDSVETEPERLGTISRGGGGSGRADNDDNGLDTPYIGTIRRVLPAMSGSMENNGHESGSRLMGLIWNWFLNVNFRDPTTILAYLMPVMKGVQLGEEALATSAVITPEEEEIYLETDEEIPDEIKVQISQIKDEMEPVEMSGEGPQILIYHSHSREAYLQNPENKYVETVKWRTKDTLHNVVRVGEELAKELREKHGLPVLHDRTDHESPYSSSYPNSLKTLMKRMEEYPSLKMFIDVHRDGFESKTRKKETVTIDGKKVAKVMVVVGTGEGSVGGFKDKPKWQENYKLAKKITDEINKLHPSLAKPVLVKSGRYNQHVSTNAILLEMGSNLNPLDEVLRAVPYVAKAIREVFK
ncbi:MAG: stage II sporulation protein P [Clostridia bacterium]|jgi:stage II sporulation protein P